MIDANEKGLGCQSTALENHTPSAHARIKAAIARFALELAVMFRGFL